MSTTRSIGTRFDGGLRMPNYVNGRVLHAADLLADQQATLARLAQLGTALGYGIVEGLTVQQTPGSTNSLQVQPGLGINPRGDLIQLAGNAVTLALIIAPEPSSSSSQTGLFQPCASATPGTSSSITSGAYLLTVLPVSRLEGTTPLNTAADRGQTVECAAKWVVEGLEFKAIRLTEFGTSGVDSNSNASTRRNRLAHWCLGSRALGVFPYPDYDGAYSGIDRLSANDRTPCDLPLAVFYWAAGSLSFVDTWAARRRVTPASITPAWSGFFGAQRTAAGEARMLQFQEQLNRLLNSTDVNPQTLRAVDHFPHLPPAGFLPTTTLPLQALAGGGFRLFNIFFTAGQNPNSVNYPAWYLAALLEPIRDRFQQASGPFVRLSTFWGDHLPEQADFVNLEQVDLLLTRAHQQDAIDLVQVPTIKISFIEEYLLLSMARLLLDGLSISSNNITYNVLDVLAQVAELSTRDDNPARLSATEWLLLSLSTYLNMTLSRLEEALNSAEWPRVLFAKELIAPVSIPFETATEDTGNVIGGLSAADTLSASTTMTAPATPVVAHINATLNRPNVDATRVMHELTSAVQPAGTRPILNRTQVFRQLRRR